MGRIILLLWCNCNTIILTNIFGDNFSFVDDTEIPFGLPKRKFSSFENASKEAAISRFYGGIHYKASIENGIEQGKNMGDFIVSKLKMTK